MRIKEYLVDVNLPYHFSFWHHEHFMHQHDLDPQMSDRGIWDYAKNNNLTIITKDTDFADRIINQEPPPRVIHLKIGNLTLKELHDFFTKHWIEILAMSKNYKLLSVYPDRIEGVD